MIRFIFTLTLSAATLLGVCQPSIKDTVLLNEAVVTGSKYKVLLKEMPMTVSQISRNKIEQSGHINVLPVISQQVPGVFVTERNVLGFGVGTGGSGAITIRGIGGTPNTEVLVLIDGHPQYQGIFGHPLADAYVASDVEKVEVIRGPASILYGSNAMGGVISIITKRQMRDGFTGSLGSSYGSYNTQKYCATLGYKQKGFRIFGSINHDNTDGYRTNTDFSITNGYIKAGYDFSKNLSLSADYSIASYQANDNGRESKPAPFHIDIARSKASISLDNTFEKVEGALKVYHNYGVHDLSDGWHSTDRNSGIMLYQTLKFFEGNRITLGVDYKTFGGRGNNGKAKNEFKSVDEAAGYAYIQQTVLKKLNLNAGIRLENNSMYGNELIPQAGFSYSATSLTSFKGVVSKGFRSPTIMELYLYTPNPDLKPERLTNYELSWLQVIISNKLSVEVTGFAAKGSNIIAVEGKMPNAQRKNSGSFENKGIEFSSKYFPINNLTLNATYAYLNTDKTLLAAPKHHFNLGAHYTYRIIGLGFGIQHVEKLYTSTNPEKADSYTLLNARLSVNPHKFVELFVSGSNLLNQKYEINNGYPMPGTCYQVGVNIRY